MFNSFPRLINFPITTKSKNMLRKSENANVTSTCKATYLILVMLGHVSLSNPFKKVIWLCRSQMFARGGFLVRLQPKQMLEEKCELKLQVERNLDKTFCHRVPDLSIKGGLSKVHATVDSEQVLKKMK